MKRLARFRVGRLEVWFDEWAARHYGGIHVRWWGRCPHRCPVGWHNPVLANGYCQDCNDYPEGS